MVQQQIVGTIAPTGSLRGGGGVNPRLMVGRKFLRTQSGLHVVCALMTKTARSHHHSPRSPHPTTSQSGAILQGVQTLSNTTLLLSTSDANTCCGCACARGR